jgi:hypothetical protein
MQLLTIMVPKLKSLYQEEVKMVGFRGYRIFVD